MSSVDLRLLAARVKAGDRAVFRQIVEHTRAPLFRLAARMLGNMSDAEDVLQDAYVSAFRSLLEGRYDGRSKFETWMYRVVANACIDALRRRKVRQVELPPEPQFDGAASAETRIALSELDALLGTLNAQDRAVVLLVLGEGLTVKEAAEALGSTEGAVEQRLMRSRAALRKRRDAEEASGG